MPAQHQTERWRPIPGFDGYEASNLGRVRSWRARYGRRTRPLIRKLIPNVRTGYLDVMLWGKKPRLRKVSQLILEAFVGLRPAGYETRHLDGNITNNRLDNLAWGTRRNQFDDQVRHGTDTRGERNGGAKLSHVQVRIIRRMLKAGHVQTWVAKRFGVSDATVTRIKKGQRYANAV